MKRVVAILSLLVLGACAAPEPPLPSTAEVRTAIEEANQAFAQAFNNKDVDGLAGFYKVDAVVLAPNREAQAGLEGVRRVFGEDVEIASDLNLVTADLEVLSDSAAIERGNYTIQVTLPGQEESIGDKGSYVVYWSKDAAGSWKIHWDIWNTDLPLPQPEEPEEES